MNALPIWLLDVDGVVNAWDGSRNLPTGYRQERCNHYLITYRPERVARIRKMHDDGLVEIRWLTTWGQMANDHLGPIGVPTDLVVVAEAPEYDSVTPDGNRWWKFTALLALRDAEPDRPLVWTDDDITYDAESQMWLASEQSDNVLAISPRTSVGLTDADLDQIEMFLRECARERNGLSA